MGVSTSFGQAAVLGSTQFTFAPSATVDLGGGTLNVGTGSALGSVELEGLLENGTVHDADIGLIFNSADLLNVAYHGTLDLSPLNSTVTDDGG
jgi:hypothetical protein